LAAKIARKWIHGLSDLVEVRFATLFISTILIILPVRKHICFGKKRIVQSRTAWRTSPPRQNFIPGEWYVRGLWDRMKQSS